MEETMARPRRILVDVLAIMFGISSWVEISGLGVEMPIMVQVLPEGWALGSYVVAITQLGNLGPLLYSIARKYKSHQVLEIPTIHVILLIAAASCLLLSFFWDKTSIIAGTQHSTALLSLAFCLALVDSTSSVLYLPFMATFREIYVISCMIGEGACGLIPSIAGFIQGVEGASACHNQTNSTGGDQTQPETRFSVGTYFVFLFFMVVISWIAFVLLDKLPSIQDEKVSSETRDLLEYPDASVSRGDGQAASESVVRRTDWFRTPEYYSLMAIQTYVCVMQNGILSSIQSYSCMPYGSLIYHLAVNLSLISNPIGCAIALFRPFWTLRSASLFTLFSTAWAVYILAIALLSPTPPMRTTSFGGFLIVVSWVVYVGSVSYIKASIAAILRRHGGNKALFWGGAMSQVGSAFGGILMFFVVKYTDWFKSSPSC